MCCLWLARDPDNGRTWVYRELYESGLTDPEQAERIREMTPDDERIVYTLADPSMWITRTTEKQAVSSAEVYQRYGVPLMRANNDRIPGWRRVHEALSLDGDETPMLQVMSTCRNLIRTLPALPYDPVRIEDVDTDAEDHAADTLRYGLSWRVAQHRPPTPGKDMFGHVRGRREPVRESLGVGVVPERESMGVGVVGNGR
jgi:hypothetical protein